ncbi:MAG: DUF342 domain-containing protein [Gammaproteobacteria bacterium]|nr:DUF342 domain-containing protein [Gammaproteobacteria bacterium]
MITQDQLDSANQRYEELKAKNEGTHFGRVLVNLGFTTIPQIRELVQMQEMSEVRKHDYKFGSLVVEAGLTNPASIADMMRQQAKIFRTKQKVVILGDLLTEAGVITEEQKNNFLKAQHRFKDEVPGVKSEDVAKEKVEPVYYDLIVSTDSMSATLVVVDHPPPPERLDAVMALLKKCKISRGIRTQEEIIAFLNQAPPAGTQWEIAVGFAPRPGVDASIRYHFNTDPLKIGEAREHGAIDFRDRGEIEVVEKDTLLATLTPAIDGQPGESVYGKKIPPPAIKKLKLSSGKGVYLSDDKLNAFASTEGSPALVKGGGITVLPSFTVKGNVDYRSGNIKFKGEVTVKGSVLDGFKVKAKRLVAQEIGAAKIKVKGDVVVSGGIVGATIRAGGSVMAKFIHNSTIEMAGDLLVKKEIMKSKIVLGGEALCDSCHLFSSTISSCGNMIFKEVGNEARTSPATLRLGRCDYWQFKIDDKRLEVSAVEAALEELNQQELSQQNLSLKQQAELNSIQKETTKSEAEIKEIQGKIRARGGGTPAAIQAVSTYNKLIEKLTATNTQREARRVTLLTEIEAAELATTEILANQEKLVLQLEKLNEEVGRMQLDLEERLEKPALLTISGTLHPLNHLSSPHAQTIAKDTYHHVVVREKQGENEKKRVIWGMSINQLKTKKKK